MSTEKSYIDDLLNSLEKPLPKVAGEIPPQFLKKDKDEAEDKGDKKEEKKKAARTTRKTRRRTKSPLPISIWPLPICRPRSKQLARSKPRRA
jgi:hypothetical protein